VRIKDIVDAIRAIQAYVAGMDLKRFQADIKTVDAVVYRFAVIGEAANNIPRDIMEAYPEIPWRDMRDMRNVVVHVYFGVNHQIV
jgi:uncharacterized protein with HEPN domain